MNVLCTAFEHESAVSSDSRQYTYVCLLSPALPLSPCPCVHITLIKCARERVCVLCIDFHLLLADREPRDSYAMVTTQRAHTHTILLLFSSIFCCESFSVFRMQTADTQTHTVHLCRWIAGSFNSFVIYVLPLCHRTITGNQMVSMNFIVRALLHCTTKCIPCVLRFAVPGRSRHMNMQYACLCICHKLN